MLVLVLVLVLVLSRSNGQFEDEDDDEDEYETDDTMKARVGCIPCFVKQGLSAVRLSTPDPAEQQRVLDEVLRRIQGLSLDASPALLSQIVYATVREMTGVADPFAQAKHETNLRALSAGLPDLKRRIAASPDPLRAAIQVALIGNVVDLGISGHDFDLERDLAQGARCRSGRGRLPRVPRRAEGLP